MEAVSGADPDGSIYGIIDFATFIDHDQFSQELQLSGLSIDERLKWVFGVYYFQEDAFNENPVDVYRELRDFIGLDISFTTRSWVENKSYAVFGQGTYEITDKLSLTGGLRYTYDKKDVTRDRFRHFSGLVFVPLDSLDKNWDAVTGRAGAEYQWNDDVMTYASVARGFKSGGINARSLAENDFLPFDPEFIWTYEVGLRSEWFDRRLRFNASLYYSDYSDIQFTVIQGDPDTGEPITVVDNAAKARIKGFEADLIVAPAPGLTLTAGVGLIDTEYTRVDPGTPITTDTKFTQTPK